MKKIVLYLMLLIISVPSFTQNFGRQLFTDSTMVLNTNMKRMYGIAMDDSNNPVVRPDKEWELNYNGDPYAAPFSGGTWFDEKDGKFKMWYSAGGHKKNGLVTCYAESDDGIHWLKPNLDVVKGTNIVDTLEHDCCTVLLDKYERDKSRKYKMFVVAFNNQKSVSMYLKYSSDGIHWSRSKAISGELFDRCSAFYDPLNKKYVLSLKTLYGQYRRSRAYLSNTDPELLVSLAHRVFYPFEDKYIKFWFHADDNDPRNPCFPDITPQIYNHDAIPYENILLGQFTVWQGAENNDCIKLNVQKRNEVLLGFSYDGFKWNRENKTPFLRVSDNKDSWKAGNVQSSMGSPLIIGDSLYFYYSARYNSRPKHASNFSTGLAKLRRDGFIYYEAKKRNSFLITKEIEITSPYLFVNIDTRSIVNVSLLDEKGNDIEGFGIKDFYPIRKINSTCYMVHPKNDMKKLMNKKVHIAFYSDQCKLYSFWFAKNSSGISGGYTAGGGPGFA